MAIKKRPIDKKRKKIDDISSSVDNAGESQGHRTLNRHSLCETSSDITASVNSDHDHVDHVERVLSAVVRQQSDATHYEKIGAIRIFDVVKSPDTAILRHDRSIKKVFTVYDLREALENPTLKLIMVPDSAAVSRVAVSDICEYYLSTKTIFVET